MAIMYVLVYLMMVQYPEVSGTENMYEKSGFKSAWCVRRVEYAAAQGALVLKSLQPAVKILPVSSVQFHKIVGLRTSKAVSMSVRYIIKTQ